MPCRLEVPPHPSELSVLERQRARLGCEQQKQQPADAPFDPYVVGDYFLASLFPSVQEAASSIHGIDGAAPDGKESSTIDWFFAGWPDLAAGVQFSVAAASNADETTTSMTVSNGSSRKRRPENSPKSKQEKGRDEGDCKRVKEEGGGGGAISKPSKQHISAKEASDSGDTSREDDRAPPKKTDYIHVRARRGQATDSHSLAERVRRERISQRMKYLQDLVPGCSKITGKAGMLDEIINYVQSLQRQVEFLSMKLAAVNPMVDVNIDSFFGREITPGCKSMGMSPELLDHRLLPYDLPFNSVPAPPCSGLHMFVDPPPPDPVLLRQAASTPMASPDAAASSLGSCLNVSGTANSNLWSANSYGVEFQLGRGTGFPFQSLQGNASPGNLKMEM